MQTLASVFFAFSLLASTALGAAQVKPQASPSTPPMTTAPQTAPSTTTTTTVPGQPNFGQLMSALNNMRAEIAKVQTMNGSSANSIRPVNVATLSGSNPSALSSAVSKNQSQLNALRNALSRVTVTTSTNQRITVAQFLADNKINTSQIVGADVNNGTLVLFYQKP